MFLPSTAHHSVYEIMLTVALQMETAVGSVMRWPFKQTRVTHDSAIARGYGKPCARWVNEAKLAQ